MWPGFVQRMLDNKLSAFTSGPIHRTIVGLPELDKLIVRQTKWGVRNELCCVHTTRNSSPCLYSPVTMLTYKREAFLHNAANGSFQGSQNHEGRSSHVLSCQNIWTVRCSHRDSKAPSLKLAKSRGTGSSMRHSASIVWESLNKPGQWIIKQSGTLYPSVVNDINALVLKATELEPFL